MDAERVPADEEEAACLYRSLLDGRRALVVLDNASTSEQVRPLLPGSPDCAVVVTSRDLLTGLAADCGSKQGSLDALTPRESWTLLTSLIGARRADAEPDAVADLARSCGYLPLALRVVGADLGARPYFTVHAYADELREQGRVVEVAGDHAVRAAFDLSYERLEPVVGRMFRLLGLVPGPDFTVDAAAALADCPPADAGRVLTRLVSASLVQEHAAGRYRFHDLLRDYAAARAEEDGGRQAAINRLYDFYLRFADAATHVFYPNALRLPPLEVRGDSRVTTITGPDEALEWLDSERSNLLAATASVGMPSPHRTRVLTGGRRRPRGRADGGRERGSTGTRTW